MKCLFSGNQIITEPKVMIDFDYSLDFFYAFYKAHGVKIIQDFAKVFWSLWNEYREQILMKVEVKGYDFLLLGLPVSSISALDERMTGSGTKTKFFMDPAEITEHPLVKKPRLVLLHSEPDLPRHDLLYGTLGKKAQTFLDDGITTTLSDYRVFSEVIWETKNARPEVWGLNLCPGSRVGTDFIRVRFNSGFGRLEVTADASVVGHEGVGCRPSRCFNK
ncbi:MAG: hypothetical protein NTU76_03890 [Candidatus Taylorbacteria bacterium]|nr:hypothetical protein [Candidatus Taylorbacteria bacterium]